MQNIYVVQSDTDTLSRNIHAEGLSYAFRDLGSL